MFGTRTIESVLATAKKVVTDLNEISKEHATAATRIETEVKSMTAKMDDHTMESVRAAELAAKWADLVE